MSRIINRIQARELLDSRGNPTIEVEIAIENGIKGSAIVPSGASTGKKEAVELRDLELKRYNGKGVQQAVQNVQERIYPHIIGLDVLEQRFIDTVLIELDNTNNKSFLGANAMLATSLAVADCAAKYLQLPLFRYIGGAFANIMPVPMMNVINGGCHASNNLDFQEFMIIPLGFDSFRDILRQGVEIFHSLKYILEQKGLVTAVGDEGGFAPQLGSNQEAFDILMQAVEKANYKPGEDTFFALDSAADTFYKNGKYHLSGEEKILEYEELVEQYNRYIEQYPLISIEDGFSEDDKKGWMEFTKALSKKIQIVGDDLFVTNQKLLQEGIQNNIANSILIKPNQIGTLTETINTIQLAKKNQYNTIISHRSGETEDVKITEIAVGVGAGQIKTGSLSRTDRIAKYNQLLRIEEILKENTHFAGKEVFSQFLKAM